MTSRVTNIVCVCVCVNFFCFPFLKVRADSYQSCPAYDYPSSSCNGYATAAAELPWYGPLVSPYYGALACAPQLPGPPPAPCSPPVPSTCFRIPCAAIPCSQDLGGLVSAPCPSPCPVPCAPRPPSPCSVPCGSPPFAPPRSSCSPWSGATTACFSPSSPPNAYGLLSQPPRSSGLRREPAVRPAPKPRRIPKLIPLKLMPYPRVAQPPQTSTRRSGYETILSALARDPSAFSRSHDGPPPSTYGRYE